MILRDSNEPESEIPLERVYEELRRLADHYLSGNLGHTLQPTALIHEAYLRLRSQDQDRWHNEQHFVALAATMMRRALIDYNRGKKREKRGGDRLRITLSDVPEQDDNPIDFEQLDRALDTLEGLDARQARIVELRFFGQLSVEETAGVLGISPPTVKRDWAIAKMWLYRFLQQDHDGP